MQGAADGAGVVYEFFAPFAHVEGRYEWCRVRSPTHGVFDLFVTLGGSTSAPADVWHASREGARFLAERYPECRAHRAGELRIRERPDGRAVLGELRGAQGPLRAARMRFEAGPGLPRQVPYGGAGRPVWGSRLTCWGVDLVLDARVAGSVERSDGSVQRLRGPALLTLGSFGRLAPLPAPP